MQYLLFLLVLIIITGNVYGQTMCNTPSISNYSAYNQDILRMEEQGPFYIRIYVHVIRDEDGTGGQSIDDVHQALAFLDLDFNQHNIFFVWNCFIDYINDSTYYKPNGVPEIFNINRHTDGIDIYLFPESPDYHPTGHGAAEGIGSTAFYVGGNQPPPLPPTLLVPSHVMSHEMGHCFHLWHTWDGPNNCQEFVNGTNCDVCGDLICDSPAEPPGGMNFIINPETCTWLGSLQDTNGDYFNPDEKNLMTYSSPECIEYFTPQQAQRMRNSIAVLDVLQPCLITFTDIPITGVVNWNTPQQVNGNVLIENQAILTITSTVSFTQHSKIIVKPGGKLIVNGGVLTNVNNYCSSFKMWQGIEVWGNSSVHQYPNSSGQYQQGHLELNNATIKNAKCAVDLWKPGDYTTTGGILIASNTTFLNNAKAIHALYYRNYIPLHPQVEMNYDLKLYNCTFTTNNDYIPNFDFKSNIDIDHIKGTSVYGCDFLLAANVAGVADENRAIASNSSGFSVHPWCTSTVLPCPQSDSCRFEGFYQGIYTFSDNTNIYTYNVNAASFNNNKYGIYGLNVKNQSITRSIFNISNFGSLGCPNAEGFGLHFNGSSGFCIEENIFAKAAGAPSGVYTGIYIGNTNAIDDVYKNTFTGLSHGNYADGLNVKLNSPLEGLTFTCNTNTNNWADFYVPLPDPATNKIQQSQGDITTPAGNIFSNTGVTWHFYNGGGNQIEYYHSNGYTNQDPNELNKCINLTDHGISAVNQCPSHSGNIIINTQEKFDLETVYTNASNTYTNVKALFDNLKDGGSTSQTLEDIQNALPQDMWALRTVLLGASPHLSEEVLRQVTDRTDVFTESAIFDILAANPDELKKEELLLYLEEKESPLPDYMIDILRQVATGTTYKTVLLQEMARYSHQKSDAANRIIRSYLNDTVTDLTMVRNWLDNLGGIEADKQIIATYIQDGNYTNALALATLLPDLYPMDSTSLAEHNRYLQLLGLYQTLDTEGRHPDALAESEKLFVEWLAGGSNSCTQQIARGILTCYYDASYPTCLQTGGQSAFKSSKALPDLLAKVYELAVAVKPNPAGDWAAFTYSLPENTTEASLTIQDVYGKTVESITLTGQQGQKLWDTRKYTPGIYLFTLTSGNLTISDKLIILR